MSLELLILASLVVAALFVLIQVRAVQGAEKILQIQISPQFNFSFQNSWVANLTLISTFFAVLLRMFDSGVPSPHAESSLSFLFAMLLALAALTYVAGDGLVWVFLLADFLSIWSVVGASFALIPTLFLLSWLPPVIQWLGTAIVVISLIEVGIFAGRTMRGLLEKVVAANANKKMSPSGNRLDANWSMR